MIAIMFASLMALPGIHRRFVAGTFLFHRGDPVTHIMVVLSGEVRLIRHQSDGRMVTLQRAAGNSLVAEASLLSDSYHCDGVVTSEATVRFIDRSAVRQRFDSDPGFASLWVQHLAREIRDARLRAEILSLRRIKERLDAWLAWHERLPARGDWKRVAEDVGVSPEALYREIARRRRSGKERC